MKKRTASRRRATCDVRRDAAPLFPQRDRVRRRAQRVLLENNPDEAEPVAPLTKPTTPIGRRSEKH